MSSIVAKKFIKRLYEIENWTSLETFGYNDVDNIIWTRCEVQKRVVGPNGKYGFLTIVRGITRESSVKKDVDVVLSFITDEREFPQKYELSSPTRRRIIEIIKEDDSLFRESISNYQRLRGL